MMVLAYTAGTYEAELGELPQLEASQNSLESTGWLGLHSKILSQRQPLTEQNK